MFVKLHYIDENIHKIKEISIQNRLNIGNKLKIIHIKIKNHDNSKALNLYNKYCLVKCTFYSLVIKVQECL